jgi:PKD repeat protein
MNFEMLKSVFRLLVVILILGFLTACSSDSDHDAPPASSVDPEASTLELKLISPKATQIIYVGDSLVFEAIASGGKEPYEYEWNFMDAAQNYATKDPGEVVFEKEGQYPIVFRATDADGAVESLICYVEVRKDNKIESVSILSPENGKTVTQGLPLNFEGTSTGGDMPCSRMWDFGGAADNVLGDEAKGVRLTKPGTFTVTFTVTDASGDVLSDSIQITVMENPGYDPSNPPNLEISASPQKINAGETINFSSSVTGGKPPFRYQWYFTGGTPGSSTVENPQNILFATANSYSILCTLTDASGRIDTEMVSIQVLPDTSPIVTIGSYPFASNDSITIIAGQFVNFTAQISKGNAPFTYAWTFDGAAPGSIVKDPGNVIFSSAGTYNVELAVRDIDGDTGSKTVTVNVLEDLHPTAVIESPADNITISQGRYATFRGTTTPGNGTLVCLWNFDGGATNSTREDPGNVTFNTPGTYHVTFTVTDSDGDTDTDSVTVQVIGTDPLAASIISPTSDVTIIQGENVAFQSAVTGGAPGYAYSWDFDGDSVSDSAEEDPENVFDNPGMYTATMSVSDSNLGTASDTVTVTVIDASNNELLDGSYVLTQLISGGIIQTDLALFAADGSGAADCETLESSSGTIDTVRAVYAAASDRTLTLLEPDNTYAGAVAIGGDIFLLTDTNWEDGEISIAPGIRQSTGMSGGDLLGDYTVLQFSTSNGESTSTSYSMSFDGYGDYLWTIQSSSDDATGDGNGGYEISADGMLIFNAGAKGILSGDGEIFLIVDTDSSDDTVSIMMGIKQSAGMTDNSLSGRYITGTIGSQPTAGNGYRVTLAEMELDGAGEFEFADLLDSNNEFNSGSGAYSIEENGILTMDGIQEGIVSPDGNLFIGIDTEGSDDVLSIRMGIRIE